MAVLDEARAALGLGTRWRAAAAGVSRDGQASALAWLPLAGAFAGAAAALVVFALQRIDASLGAVAGVVVLEALAGRRAGVGTLALGAVKLASLLALPPPARLLPLALAPVLGRWSVVVQCYGGKPAPGEPPSSLVGRARFREFGWASVTAIGAALGCADALGLLVVVTVAAATVGLRVLAYRRAGGLTRADLECTDAVAEALVLAVLAAVVATLTALR
jgi:cobalamin synthase